MYLDAFRHLRNLFWGFGKTPLFFTVLIPPRSNMHDRKRPFTKKNGDIQRSRTLPYMTRVHRVIRWETDFVYGDRTKILSD
jgi:hypothetical protein